MASEHVSLFIFVAVMMAYPVAVSKESACNTGDLGSISGLGRFPGEGNGNPLQYSYLNRETWRDIVHGVTRFKHNLTTKPPPMSKRQIFEKSLNIN